MQNKKIRTLIITGALAGCLAIGGISAYFTDAENATNTFEVGKVDIELTEPDWVPPTKITPNQEIEKDPTITNVGVNAAFVFAEVTLPYKEVITANADGTLKNDGAATFTQLFDFEVNEGWVAVGNPVTDEVNGTIKHVYAYAANDAMTAVEKDVALELFKDNKVTFVNVVEGQGLEETSLNIDVVAKAIQTSDINGGLTAPSAVYEILNNQGAGEKAAW